VNSELLKKLHESRQAERTNFQLQGSELVINDPLPPNIDVKELIMTINKIPSQFFNGVEQILIGNFDFLTNAGKESVYNDGKIYVTNNKKDKNEMFSAIVHEIAHVLENYRSSELFYDGKIGREFVRKRLILYRLIEGYFEQHMLLDKEYFIEVKYNEELDDFLVNTIGYGKLNTIVEGLFLTPYSITSLSEYFAIGFESFFGSYSDKHRLTKVCPEIFNKIKSLQ